MQYRHLGRSPLKVSALCLGTMMFADQTDITEARRIVADAHQNGINFIDTADVYSTGQSETMVGELLRDARHDWVLATKVGNRMSDRPNESHYSRSWMLRECDASLQRLGTDHIDLYYLHRDYNGMDLEEPLRAIDALLRAGKIRYWGVSNFRAWRIAEVVPSNLSSNRRRDHRRRRPWCLCAFTQRPSPSMNSSGRRPGRGTGRTGPRSSPRTSGPAWLRRRTRTQVSGLAIPFTAWCLSTTTAPQRSTSACPRASSPPNPPPFRTWKRRPSRLLG